VVMTDMFESMCDSSEFQIWAVVEKDHSLCAYLLETGLGIPQGCGDSSID
jgi:hypothetical protein